MGQARAATFEGSGGRWMAASRACWGPGAAPVGGEWLCVAGVYHFHGGGGGGGGGARARAWGGSVVGYRQVSGAGAVGGSCLASPSCVPWWPLVGWL